MGLGHKGSEYMTKDGYEMVELDPKSFAQLDLHCVWSLTKYAVVAKPNKPHQSLSSTANMH